MRHDWEREIKATLYALGMFELDQCAEGTTKCTRTMVHRGQRMVVQARYFKHKLHLLLSIFVKGAVVHYSYTEGRPVMWFDKSIVFSGLDLRKLAKQLERLVLRHYATEQAEDILSRKLDVYCWSKAL
jgi:hypothetical protein